MYYTYIIQSEATGKLYIGQTNNLQARINKHNSDRNISTKNKGPWVMLYHKEFQTRSEAMIFEKELKSYKNKNFIIDKINRNEL
ncbi:MAG: GIY-YIG nuclease family protein [Ignavibacteria bacterium]